MILLVTTSERIQECATALQVATSEPTHQARTLYDALGLLRSNEYTAVIIDQWMLDADPEQGDLLVQHLGTATPVYVNCALAGIERVVRDVRAVLARREVEVCSARNSAESVLRSELREPLTALLLNSDLVLEASDLPQHVRSRLKIVQEMAHRLADCLETKNTTLNHT